MVSENKALQESYLERFTSNSVFFLKNVQFYASKVNFPVSRSLRDCIPTTKHIRYEENATLVSEMVNLKSG